MAKVIGAAVIAKVDDDFVNPTCRERGEHLQRLANERKEDAGLRWPGRRLERAHPSLRQDSSHYRVVNAQLARNGPKPQFVDLVEVEYLDVEFDRLAHCVSPLATVKFRAPPECVQQFLASRSTGRGVPCAARPGMPRRPTKGPARRSPSTVLDDLFRF